MNHSKVIIFGNHRLIMYATEINNNSVTQLYGFYIICNKMYSSQYNINNDK